MACECVEECEEGDTMTKDNYNPPIINLQTGKFAVFKGLDTGFCPIYEIFEYEYYTYRWW